MNHQEIHKLAMKAVKDGRSVLNKYFGRLSKVEDKYLAGLVSEADKTCEKRMEKILLKGFPHIPVLGEERSYSEGLDANKLNSGTRWILDPLDGTTNYIHQFFAYGISLGLEVNGELVYGIIDLPAIKTTYHAFKGKGAFKNGKRMKVSTRTKMKNCLVATGFSSSKKDVLQKQIEVFSGVVGTVRGVRRAGSAAFDLCMVAEGIFDAYWESGLQAWDVAAGVLLVTEAGGKISNSKGKAFQLYSGDVVASNGLIHKELIRHTSR